MVKNNKEVEDGKVCAILSYFLIGIIWFLVDDKMKKNKFVKYHVKQSLILIVASIALSIVNTILLFVPVIGWLIILVANIFIFVLWILGIVYSARGEEKELPLIGQFAKHLNF